MPKYITLYDTFSLNSCKDVSELCEAHKLNFFRFSRERQTLVAVYTADELRYVRVAVVSCMRDAFVGELSYKEIASTSNGNKSHKFVPDFKK